MPTPDYHAGGITAGPDGNAQLHLGNAYRERAVGNKYENLEQALACYQVAFQYFTPASFPEEYCETVDHYTLALEELGRCAEAHEAYQAARIVQRDLVASATTEASRAESIVAQAVKDLYLRSAQAMLHLPVPDYAGAICALEEGRAQNLRATLDLDTLDPSHIKGRGTRIRSKAFLKARDDWRVAQQELRAPLPAGISSTEEELLIQRRQEVVQECYFAFERVRDAIREFDDPDFLTPVATLSKIAQAVTASNEALVYLVAGEENGFVLAVTHNGEEQQKQVEALVGKLRSRFGEAAVCWGHEWKQAQQGMPSRPQVDHWLGWLSVSFPTAKAVALVCFIEDLQPLLLKEAHQVTPERHVLRKD